MVHVCILGAAGGIGQPLALLLKMNLLVSTLSLFDVSPTNGTATDLIHINTPAKVIGYYGSGQLKDALKNADIVVSVAGITLKPGQTRDSLFPINAKIMKELMETTAEVSPNAFIAIVSNPVNSLVPLAVEVFKQKGIKGADKRIFGVTTLDVIRAETFAAELKGVEKTEMKVPVIGGHAGITIIPLVSQAKPHVLLSDAEHKEYVHKVMYAGLDVLKAKEGKGTATLSMAYAGARFIQSLILAKNGHPNVKECSYVKTDDKTREVTQVDYFANPVLISREGIEVNYGHQTLSSLTQIEKHLVKEAVDKLREDIKKGVDAVKHGHKEL